MNPFQKLRRAVDKATLNYEMSEQYKEPTFATINQPQVMSKTKSKSTLNNEQPVQSAKLDNINTILVEQQTKYLQQINDLSSKNQRLIKSIKLLQVEKEQLIQQVCTLQKNNQTLQQKIKQIYENYGSSEDRQRKYKQEIYRINRTVQMLGAQLNTQRNNRKNALNQASRQKQEGEKYRESDRIARAQLQAKIKKLEQQNQERSSMLEYNIKKNSQQRRQSKMTVERMRVLNQDKIQQLNQTISKLKDQLSTLRTSYQLLNHKHDTVLVKCENYEHRNSVLNGELQNLQERNKQIQEELRRAYQKIHQMTLENNRLRQNLNQQRENVKLKVIQIKDQTLQLELEMYKRQCKDLLQEKAITQKINTERTFQPSYQILQGK